MVNFTVASASFIGNALAWVTTTHFSRVLVCTVEECLVVWNASSPSSFFLFVPLYGSRFRVPYFLLKLVPQNAKGYRTPRAMEHFGKERFFCYRCQVLIFSVSGSFKALALKFHAIPQKVVQLIKMV